MKVQVFTVTAALFGLVLATNIWPAVESAFGDDMKREIFSEWSKYTHICTLCTYTCTLCTYVHTYTHLPSLA